MSADPVHAVALEDGVRVAMRDGVALVADLYRPRAAGRFPVLLQRTPYGRKAEAALALDLASHGYLVALQDVRGRFDSEGEFYPFRHEADDGYDSVEWAAALDGSNGRVGMFGGSYVGATQLLAAAAAPPHLVAIFPRITMSDVQEGWAYQSGVFMLWFASSWTSIVAIDTLRRRGARDLAAGAPLDLGEPPLEERHLLAVPPVGELAPFYRDWIEHELDDQYWRAWRLADRYGAMNVLALHGGGWHDLFLKGTLANFAGMREGAATAAARDGQRLLVGPWSHARPTPDGRVGEVDFGPDSAPDLDQLTREWFDHALRGADNRFAAGAPVRIFVMGENAWRDEPGFPLERAVDTTYYLRGSGRLDAEPPEDEPPDRYQYDPARPVPSLGGRLCCGEATRRGPFDQRGNQDRPDVLVYSTPPLVEAVEVTGFIRCQLYAASSAVDTDFTAMLVDVEPDGFARYLTDGIVRARYREGTGRAEPILPGRVYRYEIDLWATSNLFRAGHRIRLMISSSNFPRFARNLNTGEPALGATRWQTAEQTIFHDRDHPSSVILPIVPPPDHSARKRP